MQPNILLSCSQPPNHFFLPSCICLLVFSSPRNFSVIWLLFHLDKCHHPVSPLSGTPFKGISDPFSCWWPLLHQDGWLTVPVLSATDLQWLQLYLLCLTIFQTTAASMEQNLEVNKTLRCLITISWPLITEPKNNLGRKKPLEVTWFNNTCSNLFRLLRTSFI